MEVYVDDMLDKSLSKIDHISHLREAFEVLRHHKMMLNPAKYAFGVGFGNFLGHMVSKRGIEANPHDIKAILDMEPPRSIKEVQKLTGIILALGSPEDTLYLYLAVSEQAVSTVLVKEERKLQKTVYYLGEFDIKYKPQTAIKAQDLADFIVKCTINDQEVGGQEIVTPEEGEKDEETTLKEYWVLHFDGASKIKSSGAGLVLQSLDGFMIEYALELDFSTTNNEAEYEALIAGLGLARAVRAKNLKFCGDSRLAVAQVNGEFEAKDNTMAKEENTTADALSQFASSKIENYPRSIYFQVLKTSTIHVINLIAPVGVASCWIDPIKTHIEIGWLPDNAQETRKLLVRALRYVLIEGLLYKRSFVIPYLKCLRPLEADEVLKEVHEGIYGQFLGDRALAHKITRLGFYWPTIVADAKTYVKKYVRCREFREYCDNNSIKLHFTSVAHPQENRQAKVANRIIFDGLKKRVERLRNTWEDGFLPILWVYRTTCKVTIEATPFMLPYGAEVVVPLEITHGSPRIEAYELEINEEGMRLTLDPIDEVRDESSTHNAEHQ
ncbi:uncharacterized protein LOC141679834 [Apium graveolens]|uniref:uncharacterized protein LOC141679834 n=1 Tax=Apium graveolens TaxID=4045 RepID=UPI003D794E8D